MNFFKITLLSSLIAIGLHAEENQTPSNDSTTEALQENSQNASPSKPSDNTELSEFIENTKGTVVNSQTKIDKDNTLTKTYKWIQIPVINNAKKISNLCNSVSDFVGVNHILNNIASRGYFETIIEKYRFGAQTIVLAIPTILTIIGIKKLYNSNQEKNIPVTIEEDDYFFEDDDINEENEDTKKEIIN